MGSLSVLPPVSETGREAFRFLFIGPPTAPETIGAVGFHPHLKDRTVTPKEYHRQTLVALRDPPPKFIHGVELTIETMAVAFISEVLLPFKVSVRRRLLDVAKLAVKDGHGAIVVPGSPSDGIFFSSDPRHF